MANNKFCITIYWHKHTIPKSSETNEFGWPVITSALIGLVTVIGSYSAQSYLSRKRDRELKRFELKSERYEALIKQLAEAFNTLKNKGEHTSDDFNKTMEEVTNMLWLYASDDVMKALSEYLDGINSNEMRVSFKQLVWAYAQRPYWN